MTWVCRWCQATRETADAMVDHVSDDHEAFDLRAHAVEVEPEVVPSD